MKQSSMPHNIKNLQGRLLRCFLFVSLIISLSAFSNQILYKCYFIVYIESGPVSPYLTTLHTRLNALEATIDSVRIDTSGIPTSLRNVQLWITSKRPACKLKYAVALDGRLCVYPLVTYKEVAEELLYNAGFLKLKRDTIDFFRPYLLRSDSAYFKNTIGYSNREIDRDFGLQKGRLLIHSFNFCEAWNSKANVSRHELLVANTNVLTLANLKPDKISKPNKTRRSRYYCLNFTLNKADRDSLRHLSSLYRGQRVSLTMGFTSLSAPKITATIHNGHFEIPFEKKEDAELFRVILLNPIDQKVFLDLNTEPLNGNDCKGPTQGR